MSVGQTTEVWVAADEGRDLIRADEIAVVRLDATGRLTAQLRGEARVTVTLLDGSGPGTDRPPDDFHRRLIRTVREQDDSSGARVVRVEGGGKNWHWVSEPL